MMKPNPDFTSRPDGREAAIALAYLPMHIIILPLAFTAAVLKGRITESEETLLIYAVGLIYMIFFMPKFLRRDFDPLCDRLAYCLGQIVLSFGLILICNLAVNGTMYFIGFDNNPNNSAMLETVEESTRALSLAIVLMVPIIEEIMFRGGIFAAIYPSSRFLAYFMSVGLFALYHVWGYAILNPVNWVYLLQYIPVSIIICRCYEKTNSIWASILLHALNNGMALAAAGLLNRLGDFV